MPNTSSVKKYTETCLGKIYSEISSQNTFMMQNIPSFICHFLLVDTLKTLHGNCDDSLVFGMAVSILRSVGESLSSTGNLPHWVKNRAPCRSSTFTNNWYEWQPGLRVDRAWSSAGALTFKAPPNLSQILLHPSLLSLHMSPRLSIQGGCFTPMKLFPSF